MGVFISAHNMQLQLQMTASSRSIRHAMPCLLLALFTKGSLKTRNLKVKYRGSRKVTGPWFTQITPVAQFSRRCLRGKTQEVRPCTGHTKSKKAEGPLAQHPLSFP